MRLEDCSLHLDVWRGRLCKELCVGERWEREGSWQCWEAGAGLGPRSRQSGAGCALQSGD